MLQRLRLLALSTRIRARASTISSTRLCRRRSALVLQILVLVVLLLLFVLAFVLPVLVSALVLVRLVVFAADAQRSYCKGSVATTVCTRIRTTSTSIRARASTISSTRGLLSPEFVKCANA